MKLKCNLLYILEQRGWSIRKFILKSGISKGSAYRMANNDTSSFDAKIVAKTCETLDIEVGELFTLVREESFA